MNEASNLLPLLAWLALGLGVVLGAIGTIVPGLPGAMFIVIGVLVHKWILPEVFSWGLVSAIVVLAFLTWLADFACTVLGAKLGGATKYGLYGAVIGSFLGLFAGLPGLVVGPFLGAIIGDLYGKRTELAQLLRSGIGASLSLVLALAARLVLLIVMLIMIAFGVIF